MGTEKLDHQGFVDQTRFEIAQTAKKMLSGELSFIEGARFISSIRFSAELDEDPDVKTFIAIESETDALPLGSVRKLWSVEALKKKQPQIDKAEKWAREIGAKYCQNLIDRFGKSLGTQKLS